MAVVAGGVEWQGVVVVGNSVLHGGAEAASWSGSGTDGSAKVVSLLRSAFLCGEFCCRDVQLSAAVAKGVSWQGVVRVGDSVLHGGTESCARGALVSGFDAGCTTCEDVNVVVDISDALDSFAGAPKPVLAGCAGKRVPSPMARNWRSS